jgi:hypothetical protein
MWDLIAFLSNMEFTLSSVEGAAFETPKHGTGNKKN